MRLPLVAVAAGLSVAAALLGDFFAATAGLALVEFRSGNAGAAEPLFRTIFASAGYASPVNQGRRGEVDALYGLFLAESGRSAEARGTLTGAIAALADLPEAAGDRRRAERALAALPAAPAPPPSAA